MSQLQQSQLAELIYKTDPEIASFKSVKISKNFLTVSRYERPIILNKKPTLKKERKKKPCDFDLYIQNRGIYQRRKKTRAVENITSLIECNFTRKSVFFTCTFADNVTDLKFALKKWHIFITRLKKTIPNLRYIAVPEFQKRGAIHFHAILNLSYVDKSLLDKYWTHGFSFVVRVYDSRGIGIYLTKYITKNFGDYRFYNLKSFYSSKKLLKPKMYYVDKAEFFDSFLKNKMPIFSRSLSSDFQGSIIKEKYYVKNLNVDKLLNKM